MNYCLTYFIKGGEKMKEKRIFKWSSVLLVLLFISSSMLSGCVTMKAGTSVGPLSAGQIAALVRELNETESNDRALEIADTLLKVGKPVMRDLYLTALLNSARRNSFEKDESRLQRARFEKRSSKIIKAIDPDSRVSEAWLMEEILPDLKRYANDKTLDKFTRENIIDMIDEYSRRSNR